MKYTAALLIILGTIIAGGPAQAQATETPTTTASLSPTPSSTAPSAPQIVITPAVIITNTAGPGPRIEGCGSVFVPCGPLPWPVVRFPTLSLPSPTAIPTIPTATPRPATVTPSPTATPTETPAGYTATPPTATASPTYEGGLDGIATLAGDLDGLSKTLQAQMTAVVSVNNTPVGIESFVQDSGYAIRDAFSVVRTFTDADPLTYGMLSLLLVSLAVTVLVELFAFVIPVLIAFVKLIIGLWKAIKP